MDDAKLMGKVRGLDQDTLYPAGKETIQTMLSQQSEELIAWAAPVYSEIVRQGRSFWVNNAAAIATVTATPTTAVTLALYNGEPDGGRSYIIDYVWANFTVNTAAALVHVGIIGALGQQREAIPTNAAPVVKNANSSGKLDTRARTIIGGTALPTALNWFPIGTSVNTVVNTLPGFQQWVPVDGKIIVPPGRYFAVHTLGSVTTTSAIMGIGWTEKVLFLG